MWTIFTNSCQLRVVRLLIACQLKECIYLSRVWSQLMHTSFKLTVISAWVPFSELAAFPFGLKLLSLRIYFAVMADEKVFVDAHSAMVNWVHHVDMLDCRCHCWHCLHLNHEFSMIIASKFYGPGFHPSHGYSVFDNAHHVILLLRIKH